MRVKIYYSFDYNEVAVEVISLSSLPSGVVFGLSVAFKKVNKDNMLFGRVGGKKGGKRGNENETMGKEEDPATVARVGKLMVH
mmetsp:Transcript_57593/g.62212  ORF Transcript_57593/g.62212 Transcript_57593/m.62212 type:complete len:83 (+) Transcript_57593:384-632(+)